LWLWKTLSLIEELEMKEKQNGKFKHLALNCGVTQTADFQSSKAIAILHVQMKLEHVKKEILERRAEGTARTSSESCCRGK
jgi:hypothetical protein